MRYKQTRARHDLCKLHPQFPKRFMANTAEANPLPQIHLISSAKYHSSQGSAISTTPPTSTHDIGERYKSRGRWTRGNKKGGVGDDRLNQNASGSRESRNSIREDRARERWPWTKAATATLPILLKLFTAETVTLKVSKTARRGGKVEIWRFDRDSSRRQIVELFRAVSRHAEIFHRDWNLIESEIGRAIFTSNLMVIIRWQECKWEWSWLIRVYLENNRNLYILGVIWINRSEMF